MRHRASTGYNTIQNCSKCNREYFKTERLGRMCDSCRRGNKRANRYTPPAPLTYEESKKIVLFVDKIQSRSGFLWSLVELNDLITYWHQITGTNTNVYDTKPAGQQLHFMYQDLVKWYDYKKSTFLEY